MSRILIVLVVLVSLFSCQTGVSESGGETNKEVVESGAIAVLDANAFKEKVFDFENEAAWKFKGERPCVIDFYADWCAPCRRMQPVLNELAIEYDGKIDIYKVNVDKEKNLSMAFGVSSIPAFIFCPKEGAPFGAAGMMSKEDFKVQLDTLLAQ